MKESPKEKLGQYFDGYYIKGNAVRLLTTGNEVFPTLEELVHKARHLIQIECYIYREDRVGKKLAEALKKAAARGVTVHLHLDSFGCLGMTKSFVQDLRRHKVEVRFFHPVTRALRRFSRLLLRRRLHRKVFVIDGELAIVGGINVAEEYATGKGSLPWLDFAVLVEGPAAFRLHKIMARTWRKSGGRRIRLKDQVVEPPEKGRVEVSIVRNFFLTGIADIFLSYLAAIRKAKKTITIANAYFLPGFTKRHELKKAVERGVRVRVIVPQRSDVWVMQRASRHLYSTLLEGGVELYEWQPSMMHAKVAVIDDSWATVGSHNFDNLSRFWNLELNLNIRDADFSNELRTALDLALTNSRQITKGQLLAERGWFQRIIDWLVFELVIFYSRAGGKIVAGRRALQFK